MKAISFEMIIIYDEEQVYEGNILDSIEDDLFNNDAVTTWTSRVIDDIDLHTKFNEDLIGDVSLSE